MTEAVVSEVGRRDQREVLRSFFAFSGMCLATLDSSIRLTEANSDFSRQFGCLPAELHGNSFCDLLHQDARDRVREQFTGLIAQRRRRFTEPTISFHQKDSTVFNGELTAFAIRGHSGGINSLMAVISPEDGSRNGRPPVSRNLLLTDLDARILEGVAAGVSTVRLAAKLYLSRGGIEYHVDILMRKLKVNNRPALVSKAYSMGLLRPGWPPRVHPDYLKLAELLVFGVSAVYRRRIH
jgi:PAS domain S-box-containing protein